jgi:hypothetical protein
LESKARAAEDSTQSWRNTAPATSIDGSSVVVINAAARRRGVDEPTEQVKTRAVACNCIDTSQQVSHVVRVHLLAFELQEVPHWLALDLDLTHVVVGGVSHSFRYTSAHLGRLSRMLR